MANHTATHLLHKALQDVLGDHVRQAGSAVLPDKLRFDFTHPQQLSDAEREQIVHLVNEKVFANLPVHAFVTPIEEARRIGAITAGEAYAYLHAATREAADLRGELERVRKEARKPRTEAAAEFEIVDKEGNVLLVEAKALKGGPLRDLSDRVRRQEKAAGVIVGSVDDGRAYLVVNLDESLVGRGLDASKLVRDIGRHIGGGGGGGRPTLAEAGGKNPEGLR